MGFSYGPSSAKLAEIRKCLKEAESNVRFVLAIILVVVLILMGLFVYGGMIEPDVKTIEQEAVDAQI